MSIVRYAILSAVLLASTCVPHCFAQVRYGSLTGNVTDPASAAVPGVAVEATNLGTNVKSRTITDERTRYGVRNERHGTRHRRNVEQ